MIVRRIACAAALLLFAAPALAAAPDCANAPIPDTPVRGMVNGVAFVPKETTVHVAKDGMEMDGAKFDKYDLMLSVDGIFNAATVGMLVKAGTRPDGKVWRVLPTDSISAQPAAAQGLPEVQDWEIALEAAHVDTSFTDGTASIRVEWGARKGNVLPGKIHFCVPDAKTDIAGSFSATLQ
jgi:hypothetical protein